MIVSLEGNWTSNSARNSIGVIGSIGACSESGTPEFRRLNLGKQLFYLVPETLESETKATKNFLILDIQDFLSLFSFLARFKKIELSTFMQNFRTDLRTDTRKYVRGGRGGAAVAN